MLLELARWLHEMGWMPPLFGYITFRAILGALTALLLSLWLGPTVIARLARLKGGQPIRTDGPQTHFSKAGTPTMGGALILLTIGLSTLLWADLRNRYVWVLLLVMVAFGAIGWLDDWIKIVKRDPNGMKSRTKYALQSLFGLGAGLYLYLYADVPAATTFYVPFFKSIALPLAGPGIAAAGLLAFIFAWNNFVFALVLASADKQPVTVGALAFVTASGIQYGQVAAGIVLSIAPTFALALYAQRYLVEGLSLGAVKG